MVRFKNRYICFEVLQHNQCNALGGVGKPSSDQRQHAFILSTRNINSLVREQVKLNFGDLGAGHIASGFQVKYFSSQTRMGIIKVPRDHCQMAIAKAGAGPVAGDSSLAAMLKESQSQISALEL
ncbi:RNA-binding protein pop5 [Kickxella alabastrina]|nr:RNA-binding protein pop5 [Kickxella alabastrina]